MKEDLFLKIDSDRAAALKAHIDEIYRTRSDWGEETQRLVQLEMGLSLTPAERLDWLEEMQATFLPFAKI